MQGGFVQWNLSATYFYTVGEGAPNELSIKASTTRCHHSKLAHVSTRISGWTSSTLFQFHFHYTMVMVWSSLTHSNRDKTTSAVKSELLLTLSFEVAGVSVLYERSCHG